MTDHKFTDEEVIKALEICDIASTCDECPYRDYTRCNEDLAHDAFALINRQKAEIERFVEANKTYSEVRAEAIKEFAERLKEKAYITRPYGAAPVVDVCDINNLVKEMTEDK